MMWKKRPYDEKIEREFIEQGVSKLIARLLSQRSIKPSDFTKFSSSDYNDLTHPYALNGVKEAAELFCSVAKVKGTVSVLTDYDVDGIVSGVLIKELCNVFSLKCQILLPNRFTHGYGLSPKSIATIKEKFNPPPDLLFITDCGTSNEKEIKELKEWSPNTKTIILDHHKVDHVNLSTSADILINWHLQEDYDETCAAGEVFQFIRGIRWLTKKVNPIEFLSLTSLAILADVSPIIGNNRIIVKNGLGEYALKHVMSQGLNALLKSAGIHGESITQEDVLFKIAPRLNAVGRLLSPDTAYELLIEQDPTISDNMAKKLNEHNDNRKRLQKEITNQAENLVKDNLGQFKHGILIYNKDWNIGLLGLVASRLSETFHKPALVLGSNGDIIKGSGRSFGNIDLKEILEGCSELFENHGGHSLAAGVTLKSDRLNDANKVFNATCEEYYAKNNIDFSKRIEFYDIDIPISAVSIKTAEMLLGSMYPYCQQFNPEPIFKLSDVTIADCELKQKDTWRMLLFYATKDGKKTELQFRMFDDTIGTEVNGTKVDIFFGFPQSITKSKYGYPSINVVDFVLKK